MMSNATVTEDQSCFMTHILARKVELAHSRVTGPKILAGTLTPVNLDRGDKIMCKVRLFKIEFLE